MGQASTPIVGQNSKPIYTGVDGGPVNRLLVGNDPGDLGDHRAAETLCRYCRQDRRHSKELGGLGQNLDILQDGGPVVGVGPGEHCGWKSISATAQLLGDNMLGIDCAVMNCSSFVRVNLTFYGLYNKVRYNISPECQLGARPA